MPWKFVPILALGLLTASLSSAQQPAEPQVKAAEVLQGKVAAGPGDRSQQMAEDIEIMRRLLNQNLRRMLEASRAGQSSTLNSYWVDIGLPQWQAADGRKFKPYFYSDTTHFMFPSAFTEAEGTYLKGQGVIYTVTLPPSHRDPRWQAEKAGPKPPSDWERARNELRGEKTATQANVGEAKEPSLAETILKALADNGHHFAQLAENESLTVVVTFRQSGVGGMSQLDNMAGYFLAEALKDQNANTRATAVQALSQIGEKAAPPPANDHELLGDLHLKQAKHKEAIEAYRKALEQNPKSTALLRKLAQAYMVEAGSYLASGADDKARESFDKADSWWKKAQEPATTNKSATAAPALPAKLIVAAPKKLLDQVGAGKISFEDFKKAAPVEYQTFPPTAEKK
jgi:hypothetical protein